MNIQFRKLLTLAISHEYYVNNCKDFDFFISSDSIRSLMNTKHVFRKMNGELLVFFEADEAQNPFISAQGITLRIGLKLLNPYFSNFTQLNLNRPSTVPVYRNEVQADSFNAPELQILTGRILSHSITDKERPVQINLKNSADQVLESKMIPSSENEIACDLTDKDTGTYQIEESYSASKKQVFYYFDSEFAQTGLFGVVEIRLDESFYNKPPEFKIQFSAKKEILKYYIVGVNFQNGDLSQFSVVDKNNPPVTFSKVIAQNFKSDDIPAQLLSDTSTVVLFKSDSPVARCEKPKTKLQLKKNDPQVTNLLPQPAMSQAKSDFIIRVSKVSTP